MDFPCNHGWDLVAANSEISIICLDHACKYQKLQYMHEKKIRSIGIVYVSGINGLNYEFLTMQSFLLKTTTPLIYQANS
jgi:hypothetical protein